MLYFGQHVVMSVVFPKHAVDPTSVRTQSSLMRWSCYFWPCRSEFQHHDRWHGGLEGSHQDEAGSPQASTGQPAWYHQPEAGRLPSQCWISKGEQVSHGLAVMWQQSWIEFHKYATQIPSLSVSVPITHQHHNNSNQGQRWCWSGGHTRVDLPGFNSLTGLL